MTSEEMALSVVELLNNRGYDNSRDGTYPTVEMRSNGMYTAIVVNDVSVWEDGDTNDHDDGDTCSSVLAYCEKSIQKMIDDLKLLLPAK